jgi:hypothetical protein
MKQDAREMKEVIRHSNAASGAFAERDKCFFHALGLVAAGAKPPLGIELGWIWETVLVLVEDA